MMIICAKLFQIPSYTPKLWPEHDSGTHSQRERERERERERAREREREREKEREIRLFTPIFYGGGIKITLNFPRSAAVGFFSNGLKNQFETIVTW